MHHKTSLIFIQQKTYSIRLELSYHLRIGPDVERKDSCCQSTQELRAVPHGREVIHVMVKIPKELHESNRILPQPGAFLL